MPRPSLNMCATSLIAIITSIAVLYIAYMAYIARSPQIRVQNAADRRDVASLGKFLYHPDSKVRYFAALGLGRLDSEESKSRLHSALYNEKDEYVRVTIASGLFDCCKDDKEAARIAIGTINSHLDSRIPAVRRHAIACLCLIREVDVVSNDMKQLIVRMLSEDLSEQVRSVALRYLVARSSGEERGAYIFQAMDDTSEPVRYRAWVEAWANDIRTNEITYRARNIAGNSVESDRTKHIASMIVEKE